MNKPTVDPYMIGPFAIRPHPMAPLFDDPLRVANILPDLLNSKPTEGMSQSSEAFDLIRQLGYVSLWFFLRHICGAPDCGPYEQLDDSLSIDMCNVRQSPDFEDPGSRGAAFLSRGFFKSTVFSHGGDTWDLLRDPEETILIANAIDSKATEFVRIVQSNFSENPLVATFYPEYCNFKKRSGDMTATQMFLPNKKRSTVEPSIRAIGASGAAEGGHYSLIDMDDLVGLDSINQGRGSNANMESAKKWFRTNRRALLRNQSQSRVVVVATRYAIDDCYEDIYKSVKNVIGWTRGDLQPTLEGEWTVYWRLHEEENQWLRPDIMDEKEYTRLLRDDPWSAITQYGNEPNKTGLSEFATMKPGSCKILADDDGKLWIKRDGEENFEDTNAVRLQDCDVVMTIDPAATDKGVTAKTCRTSVGVWASDSGNRKYRIGEAVGFFSITKMMDEIFRLHSMFQGYIRITYVESNAFQNILEGLFKEESRRRGIYINPRGVSARGDKIARIRTAIGDYGMRGQIFLAEGAEKNFLEELRVFPMASSKMDVLDESEKGITYSMRPATTEEKTLAKERDDEAEAVMGLNPFGY